MTWARLEDRFPWHRKVRGLSDAAFRLHVSAVCWSNEHLTDGRVMRSELRLVSDVKRPTTAANELTTAGLWDENDERTGWELHDFLSYNESRIVVLARREADAERKRLGRQNRPGPGGTRTGTPDVRSESSRSPAGQTTGLRAESTEESSRTTPTHPEPVEQPASQVVAAGKPPTRSSRIPDEFPLSPALLEWGREHAPAVDGRSETEQWLDYHRAKGDTAKDWTASWRTWMRRAQKDTERTRPSTALAVVGRHRPSTTDAAVAQTLALAAELRREGA